MGRLTSTPPLPGRRARDEIEHRVRALQRLDAEDLTAPGNRRLPDIEGPQRIEHGAGAGDIRLRQRLTGQTPLFGQQVGAKRMGADHGHAALLEERRDVPQKRIVPPCAMACMSRGINAMVTSSSAAGSSAGRVIAPAKQISVTPTAARSSNSAPRRSNRAGMIPRALGLDGDTLERHDKRRPRFQQEPRQRRPCPR